MKKWLATLLLLVPGLANAGVSQDANGWTVVTTSGDSRVVYVSSLGDGSDSDDGLSEANAKATLAAGKALIRDNFPDHLLLKKGSTFTTGLDTWTTSGRSATEPQLIGAYGTGARPSIHSGTANGITVDGNDPNPVDYLFLIGIEFYSTSRDPNHADYAGIPAFNNTGIYWKTGTGGLIEDCAVRFYGGNMLLQPIINDNEVLNNLTVRRNVIVDSYAVDVGGTTPHSQGIFTVNAQGLIVEENVFDHNGYLLRDNIEEEGGATVFNHNFYSSGCYNELTGPVIFRGNITANASAHGFHRPPGGIIFDNLSIDNPLGLLPHSCAAPAASASITTYNVIEGSADVTSSLPRGSGIRPHVIDDVGAFIDHNLVLHEDSVDKTNQFGLNISCCVGNVDSSGDCAVTGNTCTNVVVTNNIWYDWTKGCPKMINGTVTGFTYENNFYSDVPTNCTASGTNGNSATHPFRDSTRTVSTYASTVLGLAATHAAFITAARAQSKDNWDVRLTAGAVNDWIREGFFVPRGTVLLGGSVTGGKVQ